MMQQTSRKQRRKQSRKRKTWPKVLIAVIAVLLCLILAVGIAVNAILSKINYDKRYKKQDVGGDILVEDVSGIDEGAGDTPETLPQFEPLSDNEEVMEKEGEHVPFDMSRLGELQDATRRWCANGSPVSSKKVTNILLVGMDNQDLYNNSRADAMILISINTETGKIIMTSFLRDAYTYVSNGEYEIFEKMNLANNRGGPEFLISVIEKHYKVQIDNYIAVSLGTFPEIIDKLGGIDINLTEVEAQALNYYSGVQTLDGESALRYARLRKIDSDVDRTGRHQTVLLACFDKAKQSGASGMLQLINAMLPCVRTGMSKTDILGMGMTAVTSGWLDYEITTQTLPYEEHRNGTTIDGLFYWVTDYPHAAYELQMSIYEKSNINLR